MFRFKQPYYGYIYWTRNDYVEPPNSNANKFNINHIIINIIHVNHRVIVLNDVDSYLDLFHS